LRAVGGTRESTSTRTPIRGGLKTGRIPAPQGWRAVWKSGPRWRTRAADPCPRAARVRRAFCRIPAGWTALPTDAARFPKSPKAAKAGGQAGQFSRRCVPAPMVPRGAQRARVPRSGHRPRPQADDPDRPPNHPGPALPSGGVPSEPALVTRCFFKPHPSPSGVPTRKTFGGAGDKRFWSQGRLLQARGRKKYPARNPGRGQPWTCSSCFLVPAGTRPRAGSFEGPVRPVSLRRPRGLPLGRLPRPGPEANFPPPGRPAPNPKPKLHPARKVSGPALLEAGRTRAFPRAARKAGSGPRDRPYLCQRGVRGLSANYEGPMEEPNFKGPAQGTTPRDPLLRGSRNFSSQTEKPRKAALWGRTEAEGQEGSVASTPRNPAFPRSAREQGRDPPPEPGPRKTRPAHGTF